MQMLALTYRGEAMKKARIQLSATTTAKPPEDSSSLIKASHPDSWIESQFMVIVELTLMDYLCFPAQARVHFAASRELIRSFTSSFVKDDIKPVNRRPSFIRNRQLHHVVTAFESTHLGSESLVWDSRDIVNLRDSLRGFMSRLSKFNAVSAAVSRYDSANTYNPRINPQSLVWRCLTKPPAKDGETPFSEFNGQLAIIMILCSIFMDYEPSMVVPNQCVSDLEDALITLGEKEALKTALNIAWMVAGGMGAPIESSRQRLWSTMGMLYVFRQRHEHEPTDEDQDLMHRLDDQFEFSKDEVKRACLEFLSAKAVY